MWSDSVWLVAIAISAVACALIAPAETPVDRALPVIAAAVVLLGWLARRTRWWPAILCGVPLLAGCVVAFPAEQARLIGYGVVVAAAFAASLIAANPESVASATGFVVIGVALLRWIARSEIQLRREALLVILALTIPAVMPRRRALGVALALVAALLSPTIPNRTSFIPLLVACLAWAIPWRLILVPGLVSALVLLPFPWSGVAARAPLYFAAEHRPWLRIPEEHALRGGESIVLDVPEGARYLLVSVANGLELRRGREVARVGSTPVRMGQISDWGAGRREVWWRANVRMPAQPTRGIIGYGYDAWIEGAGAVRLPDGARTIEVAARPDLPREVLVQVEAFAR